MFGLWPNLSSYKRDKSIEAQPRRYNKFMPDASFKKFVHSVRPQAGRYSRALLDVRTQAMFGTV